MKTQPNSLFSILDFEGNILYANPSILRLGQYLEHEMVGSHVSRCVEESEIPRVNELIQKIVNEEVTETPMVKMIRKDGKVVWLTSYISVSYELREIYLLSYDMSDGVSKYLELKEAHQTIEEQAEKLKRKEIALMEVIQQMESEKRSYKAQLSSYVSSLVLPMLAKLRTTVPTIPKSELSALESSILQLVDETNVNFAYLFKTLTAKEIQICSFIKKDMSNKEIAQILGLSPSTIETHRRNIRKKLGLNKSSVHLKAYLQM